MVDDPDRRGFLKVTACALGGGLGLAVGVPALRVLAAPDGETTVSTPHEPLDVGAVASFPLHQPTKVTVLAPQLSDAWTTARDVVLGAAWVHRTSETQVEVFSAVCPHLGCGIGFDAGHFTCPCHDSAFDLAGARQHGPAKRGLDTLAWHVVDGRLRITWVKYALDTDEKTPG